MAHAAADLLVRLLRMSIRNEVDEPAYWQGITDDEWQAGYLLSIRHNVTALAWQGVILLPAELQPDIDLKVNWLLAAERWQQKYATHCKVVAELSAFLAKQGIGTVVLKGVGLSTYFPTPSAREGNDIDIFTFSLDRKQMTDEEANRKTNELMVQGGCEVKTDCPKHATFSFRNILVENHSSFLNIDYVPKSREIEHVLHQIIRPQQTALLDGKYQILMPSLEFSILFAAAHAAQHLGNGLSLRHLYDWVMLKRHAEKLPVFHFENEHFMNFYGAFDRLSDYLAGEISLKANGKPEGLEAIVWKDILEQPFAPWQAPRGKWKLRWKIRKYIYKLKMQKVSLDISYTNFLKQTLMLYLKHPKKIWEE